MGRCFRLKHAEHLSERRAVEALLVSMAISDPDFGFGLDPGRLRGYPLAHLAGTWW
jgi:hypothetical protein